METRQYRLLVRSIRQIASVAEKQERFLRGAAQNRVSVRQATDADGLSIVVNRFGLIECVGFDSEIDEKYPNHLFDVIIDAKNKAVLPGLVDCHTHALWAGDRVNEFSMKLAGASYMDIHKAGGGIHSTVSSVHDASEEVLYSMLLRHLRGMLRCGTTLVECKTGYGLDWEAELKMLRLLRRARHDPQVPVDLSITYCAAHAVPKNMNAEEATADIIERQLPELERQMKLGQLEVDNIDVFCEAGVFDLDETRRILTAGLSLGLAGNFHSEELTCLNSAEMGAAVGCRAMSHLERVSEAGISEMARRNCVAVLLPTTARLLRLPMPPARRMIQNDVIVAVATDFNPNAYCYSVPMAMYEASVSMGLSLEESLAGGTLNAAASLNLSHLHGSIEVGKKANLVVVNEPKWENLIYQYGCHDRVIAYVIKDGFVKHKGLYE